ncbi:MAG: SIS domain-containing protein [Anaerolineae bacterium]|nr:SIS domain-containing protein [Anaerolineae bacterium]
MKGHHTFTEITTQTEAWVDALHFFESIRAELRRAWAALSPRQVLFIGCGSTYYLSQVAAALFQGLTGVPAHACPASELLLFPSQVMTDPGHTLLIAISRSGATTETLAAMDRFRKLRGQAIWGITCYPETPVAQEAELALVAEAAQEQSVAQTRSFTSMLVLAQALAADIAGVDTSCLSELPQVGGKLLEKNAPLAEELGRRADWDQFVYLGSGPQYGVANEAMLKMKEMSLSHSEAFHFLEYRHGPKSMADERTLVVGLLSQEAREPEQQVLDEVSRLGARVLALSPGGGGPDPGICLPSELPSWALPVLYLPPLQLLAYHRAVSKGLDPDHPRHLDAVVFLEGLAPVKG